MRPSLASAHLIDALRALYRHLRVLLEQIASEF